MKKAFIVLLCIVGTLALLCGSFIYAARYKTTDIDALISPDGVHKIIFQAVGEPEWPFGNTPARIVVKAEDKTVTKYDFDVANDGKTLCPENWVVEWQDACVQAVISGEEQNDTKYTFYFDRTAAEVEVLDGSETDSGDASRTAANLPDSATDFSTLASVNEKGESVFTVPIQDFIACYNSAYRQYHEKDYLKAVSSDGWYSYAEASPRFGYDAVRYRFSADRTVWTLPTVSVYVSEDADIYEIRTTFSDHGYQEKLFVQFKEICTCLLKMACPELSEEETHVIFDTLYSWSDENFFGDHHVFGDPDRPPLTRLLQSGNVGFYCFYGSGNIEICVIPLTPAAIELLRAEGVDVQNMQDYLRENGERK